MNAKRVGLSGQKPSKATNNKRQATSLTKAKNSSRNNGVEIRKPAPEVTNVEGFMIDLSKVVMRMEEVTINSTKRGAAETRHTRLRVTLDLPMALVRQGRGDLGGP
jgi:hypothetical protein